MINNKVWRGRIFAGTVIVVVMVTAFIMRRQGFPLYENITSYLQFHRTTAPINFVLLYTLFSTLLIPTLPLNLLAGFLWGPLWGSAITVVGAALGSLFPFLLSRYILGDYFSTRFKSGKWQGLYDQLMKNSWKVVAFTRLNPAFPAGMLNYFYGISGIPFIRYFVATVLFLQPPIIIFAILGSMIGGIMQPEESAKMSRYLFLLGIVLTLFIVLGLILKKRYQKVEKEENQLVTENTLQ